MTTPMDTDIEAVLREMTAASDRPPSLWRAALLSAPKNNLARRSMLRAAIMQRPFASAAVLMLAVGGLYVVGTASVGSMARHSVNSEALPARSPADSSIANYSVADESWSAARRSQKTPEWMASPSVTTSTVRDTDYNLDGVSDINQMKIGLMAFGNDQGVYVKSGLSDSSNTVSGVTDGRQVIRRATIEIKSGDVRAVFLKAQQLLKPDRGEFIQESGIRGEGENTTAELTIRVEASRLSEFLNELRVLGDVQSEVLSGDDVTTQMVDLEARLRNEQRVEAEVLKLLESRQDASLEEILKLRQSLGEIRARIEQMTGQREQMRRLVSLATVLVIIRTGDAPASPATSQWTAFVDSLSSAWHGGVHYLGQVVAFIVRVLVGGLIFWIALAGVVVYIRRRVTQRNGK